MYFSKLTFHPFILLIAMYLLHIIYPLKVFTFLEIGNMFLVVIIVYMIADILYMLYKFIRKMINLYILDKKSKEI